MGWPNRGRDTIFSVAAIVAVLAACLAKGHAMSQVEPTRPAGLAACFSAKTIQVGPDDNRTEYKYAVFEPKDLASEKNRKWPLLLFLHGSGECGDDGVRQTHVGLPRVIEKHRDTFPFITIMPQAHTQWFTGEDEAAVWVMLEQALRDYPVDLDRIYITGLSMGGFATWDFIEKRPDVFAAAIPVCGLGNVKFISNAKHLPIWAFHGAQDPNVPVSGSRDPIAALKNLGADPKYTEYPDGRHNIWDRAYNNMAIYDWLLEHKRQPPPTKIEYRMLQSVAQVWWLRLHAEADLKSPPVVSAIVQGGSINVQTVGVIEWYLASADAPIAPGSAINLYWNGIHVYKGKFPGVIRITPPRAILPASSARDHSSSQPSQSD